MTTQYTPMEELDRLIQESGGLGEDYPLECPRCFSVDFHGNGNRVGCKRYQCLRCGKIFN
jgi:hypothetical protein